jgi:5-(hydroxymethyl)furfural/furfural oxidase
LRAQGIEVVADRKGVGRNLRNHAAVFVGAMLHPFARQEASLRTHPTASMRFSSGMAGAPHSDLYINIQSKTSWNAMGSRLASLNAVLLKPEGSGTVALRSRDAGDEPLVEFGFGQNEGDIWRLAKALGVIIDVLKSDSVRPLIGKPYVVRLGDRIRKWNVHTGRNAFNARIYAQLLDALPQSFADGLLSRMTGNATNLDDLDTEPDALVKLVKQEMSGVYHPVGTCRMGNVADPQAVVDASGRVIGVDGLRVVDASIMPTIPRGNTNIPTIMVAEKISDQIIHESTGTNSRETLNWTFN